MKAIIYTLVFLSALQVHAEINRKDIECPSGDWVITMNTHQTSKEDLLKVLSLISVGYASTSQFADYAKVDTILNEVEPYMAIYAERRSDVKDRSKEAEVLQDFAEKLQQIKGTSFNCVQVEHMPRMSGSNK